MGSGGSHSTQNDTPLAPSVKQLRRKRKRFALQAKIEELEAQNNKTAMKNEVFQEQYEKLFEMLHEARHARTHELIAFVEANYHLGTPQPRGSPVFNIVPDQEHTAHQHDNQHETFLNPAASTRSRRSGGRHLLAEGAEELKAIYRDCRDFLRQRRKNPIHISSKINDPRVSERIGPLPRPRPTTEPGNERQVLEKYEGIRDSEVFRQAYPGSQYGESKERLHTLDETFLIPRGDGDLRKKAPVVHNSIQDPLVLQLLEEVNKLKVERQAEIPDWNQPRPGPLTRRILDTPSKPRQNRSLAYNSILEGRTRLNTSISLSPPWHTGCTPTKRLIQTLSYVEIRTHLLILEDEPFSLVRLFCKRFEASPMLAWRRLHSRPSQSDCHLMLGRRGRKPSCLSFLNLSNSPSGIGTKYLHFLARCSLSPRLPRHHVHPKRPSF